MFDLKIETLKANYRAAEFARRAEENRCRPSVILGAEIDSFLNEDGEIHYAAEFSGLRTTGETPEIAFENFDRLWLTGDIE